MQTPSSVSVAKESKNIYVHRENSVHGFYSVETRCMFTEDKTATVVIHQV